MPAFKSLATSVRPAPYRRLVNFWNYIEYEMSSVHSAAWRMHVFLPCAPPAFMQCIPFLSRNNGVYLISASTYRHIIYYWLLSAIKLTLTLTPNPTFCANSAPFATGNKLAANDMSCSRISVISMFLNADSGRWTDALITGTGMMIAVEFAGFIG